MKHETKTTPERLIADGVYAVRQLEQGRREICVEYNKRIRKVRDAIESLQTARLTADDSPELFAVDTVIDPTVVALIRNPCGGM